MENKMLEQLKDFDKEVSLGIIMIVTGILIHFGYDIGFLGLAVFGLIQVFWKKEERVQVEEHHHHHHHNNNKTKKKAPRRKNG